MPTHPLPLILVILLLPLVGLSVVVSHRLDVSRRRALGRADAVHGAGLVYHAHPGLALDTIGSVCTWKARGKGAGQTSYLGAHDLGGILLGQLALGLGRDLADDLLGVLLLVVDGLGHGWKRGWLVEQQREKESGGKRRDGMMHEWDR
jgi:hypothetical protein